MLHSEETKIRISKKLKGRKLSPEHILKMKGKIVWNKGKTGVYSKETLKKMRENRLGKQSPNKGKKFGHWSNEHKQKISKALLGIKKTEKHRKKISESKKGNKNPQWKGGITSLVIQIRNNFRTRQWRSDIFTRDNFTCQLCFARGVYIEADHYPKMFSTIFHENKIASLEQALACEEFWNINNGRTLCRKCHNNTKLGRGK